MAITWRKCNALVLKRRTGEKLLILWFCKMVIGESVSNDYLTILGTNNTSNTEADDTTNSNLKSQLPAYDKLRILNL